MPNTVFPEPLDWERQELKTIRAAVKDPDKFESDTEGLVLAASVFQDADSAMDGITATEMEAERKRLSKALEDLSAATKAMLHIRLNGLDPEIHDMKASPIKALIKLTEVPIHIERGTSVANDIAQSAHEIFLRHDLKWSAGAGSRAVKYLQVIFTEAGIKPTRARAAARTVK